MAKGSNGDIVVREERDEITLEKSWRSSSAFFMVLWSVFWNIGMLAVIANMGFAALAVPHVWIGLGAAYYTSTLLLNKTKVTANNQKLLVEHGPLPWFGNKVLSAEDVDQIYVRERITRGKNGTSISYEVRAKMTDGKDQKLLGAGVIKKPYDAQVVEKKLEDFMGVPDYRVEGEFAGKTKALKEDTRRKEPQRRLDAANLVLENLKNDYMLDFKNQTWTVSYNIQYDWQNMTTEKFYQLTGLLGEMLLYIKKDFGVYEPYVEEPLLNHSLATFGSIDMDRLPTQIEHEGAFYFRDSSQLGKAFRNGNKQAVEVLQLFYLTEDHKGSMRIVQEKGNAPKVYLGQQEGIGLFYNILPA